MIMTASSCLPSKRMSTLGHGEPFTLTERPFARASEMTACMFWSEDSLSSSRPSSAGTLRETNGSSDSALVRGDERINVADTDVISRIDSESRRVHGRIECHSDGSMTLTFDVWQRPWK